MGVEMICTPDAAKEEILKKFNSFLPEGLQVTDMITYPLQTDKHIRKKTLMSLYAGSEYTLTPSSSTSLPAADEFIRILEEKAKELDVAEDYSFAQEGTHIAVRGLFRNKKMNNIVKFLKEVLQEDPYQLLDIRRTALLASVKGKGIISYLDLDSSQN